MKKGKPKAKPRRVVLGVGQLIIEDGWVELWRADFINPGVKLRLRRCGLGPHNRIRLVAEVLK